MFRNYKNLGFTNPYYFNENGIIVIEKNLSTLLEKYSGERRIDPVAVVEVLNKNFILADRTIINGIQRTAWLAKPNKQLNKWEYNKAPKHDVLDVKENEIAKNLFKKICDEIEGYIGNKKKIGVLLSGGMDSRMVAGALDYLIKTNKLFGIEVTGLTWGNDDSRDVVYAREIAKRLNWKWKHYKVTAKDLLNNITETAKHGCEYSPIHLHAIPQIRDDNEDLEIILAGSYGDSIGRAEYSGTKLKNLKPINKKISSVSGIIPKSIIKKTLKDIEGDIDIYHTQFPETKLYVQYELDYQIHYMRRQLNACMDLLNIKTEFHQIYTHPDVYGYMWSLNPERRNDMVYKYMLEEFITNLNDIPWARTGLAYRQSEGIPDSFKKKHHSYVNIIQNEIFEDIKKMVLSEKIAKLHLFDRNSLKMLLRLIKFIPPNHIFYLEKIIWIASLVKMIELYNIELPDSTLPSQTSNSLNTIILYFKQYFRNGLGSLRRSLKKYFLL